MATAFRFIADLERNLSNHILSGSLIFTEESIYLVKSDHSKIKYSKTETSIVNELPLIDVDVGRLYLLTTDKSINVYDGSQWSKYGKNDLSLFTTDDLAESDTRKFVTPIQIEDWNNIKSEVEISRGEKTNLKDKLLSISQKDIDGGLF